MFQALIAYMRRRLTGDYSEVNAPQILDKSLWETSGHWDWYRENMFAAQSAGDEAEDKRWFALKPMNCPGHVQIFKHGLKSYRDLPLRLAEFGVVHRYEPSGAMHGLMRVRGFTQDDAHVFCTEEQLADECLKINDLILSTYADFGFDGELTVKLSTRPEKRVGTDEMWDHAERVMATRAGARSRRSGSNRIKTAINPGEGAFYGPKFEYVLRDAIGRDWQCGTTQVDFNLPERFGAFYIDADGSKKTPVMVHRAICGSMERFIGILIEHFAGHFPLWLAPMQVVVTTITSEGDEYAKVVAAAARRAGLRVEIDLRNEKINYKVREHSLAKIPALLVVGKKEAETHSVSIRRLGSDGQKVMPTDEAHRRAGRGSDAAGREAGAGRRGLIIIDLNSASAGRRCAPICRHQPISTKEIIVPDAIELLKIRRSVKPREMSGPGPSPAELDTILTIGARVPDHGKLTPWRFIVFEGDARARAGDVIAQVFAKKNPRAPPPMSRSRRRRLMDAPLVIAVVSFTRPHPKVPAWEQELSAGASAMNIVTAATALGYGANWLTGWFAFDRDVLDGFGLKADEKLAGFIHIGTPAKPAEDRPRPALSDIVTRF